MRRVISYRRTAIAKNHSLLTAPVLLLVKFTVCGTLQELRGLPVNADIGFGRTVIFFVIESRQPPKLLTSLTAYMPGVAKTFTGFTVVEEVASPNVH